ncbi:MAG: DUF402 domain-containing protein [Catonella sp.]|uniref:DUF402 domain-containing protein n=1 Tax=Catonella sp. TaxID=2382125 RepID=UPI003F9FAC82
MINFNPELYKPYTVTRRRYIPDEIITLNHDTIYYVSDELIVSGWKAIRLRPDISGGFSAYYPKLGIKTSKLFDGNGDLLYWYNDISELAFNGNDINFTDLLIDLIVFPDNSIKILDLDEFAEAIEKNYITKEQEIKALNSFHTLLDYIYNNDYSKLQEPIKELEKYLNSQSG